MKHLYAKDADAALILGAPIQAGRTATCSPLRDHHRWTDTGPFQVTGHCDPYCATADPSTTDPPSEEKPP